MKLSNICAYSDEGPEMGFLDINLIKDSRYVLTGGFMVLFSGFKNPLKKSAKQEKT
jgi:hypothetical protein